MKNNFAVASFILKYSCALYHKNKQDKGLILPGSFTHPRKSSFTKYYCRQ